MKKLIKAKSGVVFDMADVSVIDLSVNRFSRHEVLVYFNDSTSARAYSTRDAKAATKYFDELLELWGDYLAAGRQAV